MPQAEIHGKEPIIDIAANGVGAIPKRLLKNVERFGDRVALHEKRFGLWRNISWKHYGQNIRAIFFGMSGLGARRGERICLISENRPEWLYLDLAIRSMGAIRKLIHKWFDEVNSRLACVEQIKKFAILDKRLDQEDGELTPTMKVKRKHINKIYTDVIEKMYRR